MITFDNKHQIFKLDTPSTSYVMGIVDQAYLGHIYYGSRIEDTDLGYLLRIDETPFVPSVMPCEKTGFLDSFPMEYSFGRTGDFRESCIDIKTIDGQEGLELQYISHEIYQGKKSLKDLPATWGDSCDTLEITLADKILGVQVILSYTAFRDTDVITRSVKVSNCSDRPFYLNRVLSACLDMDNDDYELLTLPGAWARERRMQRRPLGYGSLVAESLRGISSAQEHPFAAIVSKGCTQTAGEVYAMNFVYSGNFLTKVSVNQYDSVRMVMGIHPERFSWKLNPDEDFQAPEVVMTYSDEGLGKMSRTLHTLYKNHLIRSAWKDKERPILINNWEATYFDFNTEKLLSIAREAAKSGIEMLVMDDGWFGHREADTSSLGDWDVNEEKIQGGLKYLVDEVNKLGLRFGIWFEPEMISEKSELFQKHPDWALQLRNRRPAERRSQWVLDLSRPEIADYIYEKIKNVLKSANIEYVKWDMNRPLSDIGNVVLPADQQGEISHRYMLAVYRMQERLISDFPDLLLENCSSGGGRYDPGMLYYSPQIWCSDDTDALERLSIQEGTQLLYPLSSIGAHVSDCPNHITGRSVSFEARGAVALAGTFGYELDITRISEDERSQIKDQVAMYQKYNPLIRNGEYYRIASYYDNHLYDCYQVVSTDKEESLVVYVQVMAEAEKRSRKIKLQGLNEDYFYEIEGKIYQGRTLMQAGILLPRMTGDFQTRFLHLKQCNKNL